MTDKIQGVPAEGEQPGPLGQGQHGGEEPASNAPPGGEGTEEVDHSTVATVSPESKSQNGLQFIVIPRPSERRAQEFLPQWLRRLGRG